MVAVCAGCTTGPEAMLDDYRTRIGRALGVDTPVLPSPRALPAYPRARDRRVDVAAPRLSMWDLLRLLDCELARTIGQRNGTLGRVMPESQRLLLDIDMLDAAARCLADVRDAPLRARLDAAFRAKRRALPARFWNAVLGSREMARYFGADAAPLPLDSGAAPGLALVQQIDRWRVQLAWLSARAQEPVIRPLGERPDGLESPAGFEQGLAALGASRVGGALRRTVELLDRNLRAIAVALDPQRVCPQGRPTRRARILRNVFLSRYAGGVQSGLGQVTRAGARIETALGALRAAAPVAAPAVSDWFEAQLRRPLASLAAATDRHTRAWQQLFRACGVSPFESSPAAASRLSDAARVGRTPAAV